MTTPDISQGSEAPKVKFTDEEKQLLGMYGIPHKDDNDKLETLSIIREFQLFNGTEADLETLLEVKKVKHEARIIHEEIEKDIESGDFEFYSDGVVDTLSISRTIIGVLLRHGASNPNLDKILISIFDEDTSTFLGKKSEMDRELVLREKVAILGKYLFMLEDNTEDDIFNLLRSTNNESIIIVLYLFALGKNMTGVINLLENNDYYRKILAEYQNTLN